MAASHVQTVTGSASGVNTVSVTPVVAAGNSLIVVVVFDSVGTPTKTVGPAMSQTYALEDGGLNHYQYIADAPLAGGSTLITFSAAAASNLRLFAIEVASLGNGLAAFDQFTTAIFVGPGTTQSSGTTPTTTQADEFLVAAFHADGSATTSLASVTNSFVIPTNGDQLGAAVMPSAVVYRVVAAIGAYETTATAVQSETWDGGIATYKAAAGGPGAAYITTPFPGVRGVLRRRV